MGGEAVQFLAHVGLGGEEGDLGGEAVFGDARPRAVGGALQQGREGGGQAGAVGLGLAGRLSGGSVAEGGDLIEEGGEDGLKAGAFLGAGADQGVERFQEA
ncbi:hypothetical protein ACE7GA_04070 [Roseomonas sp. CCTCC AB2023176]|uniref:hypothetical protein n=1 Tax=Roseomonas sp. CCTCC AB2023176 TaxID=3342640 RepID=UPI0035DA2E36